MAADDVALAKVREDIKAARATVRRNVAAADQLHDKVSDEAAEAHLVDVMEPHLEVWRGFAERFAELAEQAQRALANAPPEGRRFLKERSLNLMEAHDLWHRAEEEFTAAIAAARERFGGDER